MRKKTYRMHQMNKHKNIAIKMMHQWDRQKINVSNDDPVTIGKIAKTPKWCNHVLCSNPRKLKGLKIQEANNYFECKEQVKEAGLSEKVIKKIPTHLDCLGF